MWGPLFHYVRIQHALLLQIMRDRVLRQQRRLQFDLGANPFPFAMRQIGGMLAIAARSEFRAEGGALDFVKLAQPPPGLIADSPGDIDFKSDNCHNAISARGTEPEPRRTRSTTKEVLCVPWCRSWFQFFLRLGGKSRGEQMIQHHVNHNPCYRYIEPEWKRPARDLAMLIERLTQRSA